MRIVIVGDGKVGFTLTQQLSKEGHDIVVIDSNRSVLMESLNQLDVLVIHGNGASLKVQKEAGVGQSDLIIAATSADEINLLCCIIAKKLGVRHTIARVRDPDYADQIYFIKEELGLSMTINPERTAALEIFNLIQYPSFLKRDAFAKGRVEIVELSLREGNPLDGKRLMELHSVTKANVLICAVERDGAVTIPDGNFRLQAGDLIYVTAPLKELNSLITQLGLKTQKIRNIMIMGGSTIAIYLAKHLLAAGVNTTIIEKDEAKSRLLADILPKATVINGDGSSQATLLAEGIEQMDAVATLTNMDEENLLTSMYANYIGVSKVITKINRTEYMDMFRNQFIGSIVVPKQLVANDIVRYVRAMQNTIGGSVITLHRLVGDKVDALEFSAGRTTRHLGRTLAEISLKPNVLIACLNRNGKIIIPRGGDTIELNDTVVVVTTSDRMFYDLNDIFQE